MDDYFQKQKIVFNYRNFLAYGFPLNPYTEASHVAYQPKPSKHFNVVSTLPLGWYGVATSRNVKSTLKQRCVCQY